MRCVSVSSLISKVHQDIIKGVILIVVQVLRHLPCTTPSFVRGQLGGVVNHRKSWLENFVSVVIDIMSHDWKVFVSVEEVHQNFTLTLGPFAGIQLLQDIEWLAMGFYGTISHLGLRHKVIVVHASLLTVEVKKDSNLNWLVLRKASCLCVYNIEVLIKFLDFISFSRFRIRKLTFFFYRIYETEGKTLLLTLPDSGLKLSLILSLLS